MKSVLNGLTLPLIFLLLIGCVGIPTDYHTETSRKNIADETADKIIPGETTKEDVFLMLGEPDLVSPDGNTLSYNWEKVEELLIFVSGGTYEMKAGNFLVITFNKEGVVNESVYRKASIFGYGEAGHGHSNIILSLNVPSLASDAAQVSINIADKRSAVDRKSLRDMYFGTDMGSVKFDPSEVELTRKVLVRKLSELQQSYGITSPQEYLLDINEFRVYTEMTFWYSDIISRITLTLKYAEKEYSLAGSHTKRTYIWPSKELLASVVEEALHQIEQDLERKAIEIYQ